MIQIATHDSEMTVRVHDELSFDGLAPLEHAFESVLDLGIAKLVVDLTECTYVDSSAITLFVRTWKRLLDRFEVLILPSGAPHMIFEVCGFLDAGMFVRVLPVAKR